MFSAWRRSSYWNLSKTCDRLLSTCQRQIWQQGDTIFVNYLWFILYLIASQGVMHPFDLCGAASHFSTAHKPSSHPSSTLKAWSWAQGKLLFNRIKVDEESFPRIWSRWWRGCTAMVPRRSALQWADIYSTTSQVSFRHSLYGRIIIYSTICQLSWPPPMAAS